MLKLLWNLIKLFLKPVRSHYLWKNNLIVFEYPNGNGKISNYSEDSAIAAAGEFVGKMSDVSGKLSLDNVTKNDDGTYKVEYLRSYKGNKLFNTVSKVYVCENGIYKMEAGFLRAKHTLA